MGREHLALRLLAAVQFVSNILFPKYPLTLYPLLSILYYFRKYKCSRFCIHSIPGDVIEKLLSSHVVESHSDVDSCILVNSNALQKIRLNSSDTWFKILRFKPNSQGGRTSVSCIMQVIGIEDIQLNDSCMLASETTLFNIKQKFSWDKSGDNLNVWVDSISSEKSDLENTTSNLFVPSVATKASIGLLQSPVAIDQMIIDDLLKNYFETCRYQFVENVLCIDVFRYAPYAKYMTHISSPKVFFKILEMEGPDCRYSDTICGYHIIKGSTALFQSTNSQCFLPSMHTSLISDESKITNLKRDYKSLLLQNCPFGLENLYNDILTSLQPFLHFNKKQLQDLKPVFLVCGPKGAGKRVVISAVAKALGMNEWVVDCLELKGTTPGYTEGKLKFIFKKVTQFLPCIIVIRNIDALCTDSEGNEDMRVIGAFHEQIAHLFTEANEEFPIIVVGTCDSTDDNMSSVTPCLARAFLHVMRTCNPNEAQREALLSWIIMKNNLTLYNDVSLSHLAARTSGFLFEDLKALVTHALRVQYKAIKSDSMHTEDVDNSVNHVKHMHFEQALEIMHNAYSDAIGAPKIPSVLWSDIGGLASLKEEITRTITMPLQHPTLIASGLRRSGILLYGPPGTGKTLLAKAVATECNLNFLSVKGPELLNMYVGQSEENIREVFQRARAAAPCIIFFDELDSLAPNRGRSGDSGGVMDRVVSQLLAELDGMQKSTHLYVIGATNRPDLIDPALLRPGRFDKLLYVGVCEDHDAQVSVMAALTRKFDLSPDVNLNDIVRLLPPNLTGADLFSVCSNAWRNAAKRIIYILEKGSKEKGTGFNPVVVTMEDFQAAASELTPSVSAEDLLYFSRLHQQLVSR